MPVIEALAAAGRARGVRISVDTVKPEVAEAAFAAGATLVNDVSASLWEVALAGGAGWVAMHMQGEPPTMQDDPSYLDVVAEVRDFLLERAEGRCARGWPRSGWTPASASARRRRTISPCWPTCPSWRRPPPAPGAPGCSSAPAGSGSSGFWPHPGTAPPAPIAERAEGSLATAAAAMVSGAGMVRVHDVAVTAQVVRLYGPAA